MIIDYDFIQKFNATKYLDKAERQKVVNSFYDPTPPINEVPKDKIVGSVYIIYNINNGMKYVGQTKDFQRRVAEYIRYSNPNEDYKDHTRMSSMYRIIQETGIENFKIKRYYDCVSYDELAEKEHEFILALNTAHPNGYNLNLNLERSHHIKSNKLGRPLKVSIPHSPDAKRKKSYPVFLIDTYTRSIIFSDSGVLFGIAVFGMDREESKKFRNIIPTHKKIDDRYFIYPADLQSLIIEINLDQINKYSLEYRYYANEISNGLEYLVSSGFDFLILRYEDNSSGYAFYSIKSYLDLLTSIRDYNKENNADNNKVMAIS